MPHICHVDVYLVLEYRVSEDGAAQDFKCEFGLTNNSRIKITKSEPKAKRALFLQLH